MTLEQNTAILGPVDTSLIAKISQTGASSGELAEAWAWFNADEALMNEGIRFPREKLRNWLAYWKPRIGPRSVEAHRS